MPLAILQAVQATMRYATEKAHMTDAEEPDDAFLLAVGAVATGHESLPEAAEKRDVDAEDVAHALSRHAHRSDYDGVLWADRRRRDGRPLGGRDR